MNGKEEKKKWCEQGQATDQGRVQGKEGCLHLGLQQSAQESGQTCPKRTDWGCSEILTAVSLVGVVVTVKVTITVPQLEGTMPIATGELVGLTGWRGAWGIDRLSGELQAFTSTPSPDHAHPSPQSSSSLPSLQSSCPSHT